MTRLYTVNWINLLNGTFGHGQPMLYDDALRLADRLNDTYMFSFHWIEPAGWSEE